VIGLVWLQWTVIGGCIISAAGVVAAFAASVVSDFRARPMLEWAPGGEWYPQTPLPVTAPLGALPSVEDELAHIWALIGPERPA
jgi:hypothetical protein